MSSQDRVAVAVVWLLKQSHLLRPEALPAAADHAGRMAGARGCRVHLISRDQRLLAPLVSVGAGPGLSGPADREALPVDGSVAGRAYRDTDTMAGADGTPLWVPLLDGTERLGVLEVVVDPADAAALRDHIAPLTALIAELVVSKGQYTDSFERTRRALPMGCPRRCCGGSYRR